RRGHEFHMGIARLERRDFVRIVHRENAKAALEPGPQAQSVVVLKRASDIAAHQLRGKGRGNDDLPLASHVFDGGLTPRARMNASLISTGSRGVCCAGGPPSMRAAMNHGPLPSSAASIRRSKSASSFAQALCSIPAPRAISTRSARPAVAAGCFPVIWYMPLSHTTTVRFGGATLAIVASDPSCIKIEPSPS